MSPCHRDLPCLAMPRRGWQPSPTPGLLLEQPRAPWSSGHCARGWLLVVLLLCAAQVPAASPCPAPATCRCPSWPYGKQGLARYCVGSLEKPRRSWVNPQRFLPAWPQARQLAPGTRKPSAASRVTGCPGEKAGREPRGRRARAPQPQNTTLGEGEEPRHSAQSPRTPSNSLESFES